MAEPSFSLAIIGVGNTLAGDDGAGIEVVRRLRQRWGSEGDVLLHTLEGDLWELADLLGRASRFVLVDAVAGKVPGCIVKSRTAQRALAPSFHQADVPTVVQTLAALRIVDPFPPWELWGITIVPPQELREGLSPPVEEAVCRLTAELWALLDATARGRAGGAEPATAGGAATS